MDSNPEIEILYENSLFDAYIELLYKCQQLPEEDLRVLCEKAIEILGVEDNVVKVPVPVTVGGDTHGQFYDLLEIFKLGGNIPETNYLFLGDYVNRGANSVELFSLLLAYKVRYPQRITLLRGGDEGRALAQARGFYEEGGNKYQNINAWKYFTEVFDNLPLAAVVEDTIFGVHSGISQYVDRIDEMQLIDRKQDFQNEGLMKDLAWNEPDEREGWGSILASENYSFGKDISEKF